MNQYFLSDQYMMLQNHVLKEQDWPLDFNITECERLVNVVSDSKLHTL